MNTFPKLPNISDGFHLVLFQMHYLMFGKGFQTWEYSPKYAIRSYAYLWIHALPISLYNMLFSTNKVKIDIPPE